MFNKEYRMLSFVPRWGIAPRLTQQSVAEHSFYVALYSSQICHLLGMGALETLTIVDWALRHDAEEAWTSDMPGPGKRDIIDDVKMQAYLEKFEVQVPDYAQARRLGTEVNNLNHVIKTADLIDQIFYLHFEQCMGNKLVDGVFGFARKKLQENLATYNWPAPDVALIIETNINLQLDRIRTEGAVIPAMGRQ